jgi:transposase
MGEVTPFAPGPLPVIKGVADDIGLTETLDELLEWDEQQCTVSPGNRLSALIMNFLTDGVALVQMPEYFEKTDTENLFGEGIQPEHLNDDCLARALDKFADAGLDRVVQTVLLEAAVRENIQTDVVHGDTTSVSVEGDYESGTDGDSPLNITYGHSKDNRPDLKQFNVGLGVNCDGVPVVGEILDGNHSDTTWNTELVENLRDRIERDQELVYVGDSKVVTEETLDAAASSDISLISRLPRTYNLPDELVATAFEQDDWTDVGSFADRDDATEYRLQSFTPTLHGRDVRCLVVHSSSQEERASDRIDAEVAETEEELGEAFEELTDRSFECEPDAKAALDEWLDEYDEPCFDVDATIIETDEKKQRDGPGRPPKEWDPYKTVYQITGDLQRDEEAIELRKTDESCFVVVTTLEDSADWPDERVLEEYKHQQTVERRFPIVEDPKRVGSVFLKRQDRVEALGYVFILALLVYSILERRARQALAAADEPMEIVGAQPTFRPTGRRVLERFENVMVIRMNGSRLISDEDVPERVLDLVDLDVSVFGVESE